MQGLRSKFPPIVGPREGSGEAATSDFVPFAGDPRERKGYVAIPPTCGPPRRQGCDSLILSPLPGPPESAGAT